MLLPAAALGGLLLAVTAPAGQASQDSISGTGRHQPAFSPEPPIQVHVNAVATADGANPSGAVFADMTNETSQGRYEGRVTCFTIDYTIIGPQAAIGIEIVDANDPQLVGMGQLWYFGDGGNGPDVIDRVTGFGLTPEPPTVCPQLTFAVPVLSGNYVMHDRDP